MWFFASKCLWHKGPIKYFKCYKQGIFYNAELFCEEAEENDILA
jgi:hypothetical protein